MTTEAKGTQNVRTHAEAERLYSERDLYALGNDYIKHTQHMTSESLHSKSDIAAELAVRDIQIRQQAAEIERLRDYDTRLSAVMPADFKDWHENSKREWPEIAAWVITNLREREAEANAEIERLKASWTTATILSRETADLNDRLASERDKSNALLRKAFEALDAGYTPAMREAIAAIKPHLGEQT